jgi:hypothetical protein
MSRRSLVEMGVFQRLVIALGISAALWFFYIALSS